MNQRADTAQQILDAAQYMVQTRGYNAFSYADISQQVGIRKASIHYHFPSKSDLGKELVTRFRETFRKKLDQISRASEDHCHQLERYTQLYLDVLQDERMCLGGMLAADFTTLPQGVRQEVNGFFDDNVVWLTKVLVEGSKAGNFHYKGSATVEAQLILAGLEGAMLMARSYGDVRLFQAIAQRLIDGLKVT